MNSAHRTSIPEGEVRTGEHGAIPRIGTDHNVCPSDWKGIVNSTGDIPPARCTAERLRGILAQKSSSMRQVIEICSCDPALAAKIMKVANSSLYGRQRQVGSINQAMMIAGIPIIRGICFRACLTQTRDWCGDIPQVLYQHSLCTALACQLLACKKGKSYSAELYTAGLMHDFGKLVLWRQIPGEYGNIHKLIQSGMSNTEAEAERLGYSHALIGALIGKRWSFPPEICQLIICHHGTGASELDAPLSEKIHLLRLGNLLAHSLGLGDSSDKSGVNIELKHMANTLNFSDHEIGLLKAEILKLYTSKLHMLNISRTES